MKIVLPVFFRPNWMGGTNYFLGLVRALRAHPETGGASLLVLSNEPERFGEDADAAQVTIRHAPWLDASARADYFLNGAVNILARHNTALFHAARQAGADVITHANPGRLAPCPTLFWMQDFQHRRLPEFFSRYERWRRDRNVRAAARSGHILFSSESAAKDFAELYPENAGARAHVLRFPPFFDAPDAAPDPAREAAVLAKHGLAGPYFFLPNQFWRHKNHQVVVEALRRLPPDFVVACTGQLTDSRGDAHIAALRGAIAAGGLHERFRLLGIVPREELLVLMRRARCVLNPSLFEGWSSTVEEAKRLGKRAILSDLPVHREQAPAAALYFPPHDADALAAAMREVAQGEAEGAEGLRAAAAQAAAPAAQAEFAANYWRIAREVAGQ